MRAWVPAGDRGRVVAVLRGTVRPLTLAQGHSVPSAIAKRPVAGPVTVTAEGVDGDGTGNPAIHGGVDQAVYAYAGEEADWWVAELGRPVPPGLFGENLRTTGIAVSGAVVGEQWRIGDVLLAVTSPRTPCGKFAAVMEADDWLPRFRRAGRPGAYLRVLQAGRLQAGDAIKVVQRPAHGVTVADLADVHAGLRSPADLAAVPDLPPAWRQVLDSRR